MQHAFLKELRGNWIHRTRFNDGDGKSTVTELESLHVCYHTALGSPRRMGSSLGNKQTSEHFVFCCCKLVNTTFWPTPGEEEERRGKKKKGKRNGWGAEGARGQSGQEVQWCHLGTPPVLLTSFRFQSANMSIPSAQEGPEWTFLSLLCSAPCNPLSPKPGSQEYQEYDQEELGSSLPRCPPSRRSSELALFPQQLFWMKKTQS